MSVFEGPLEPSSTASAANDSAEDSSFENFFSVSALFHCLYLKSQFSCTRKLLFRFYTCSPIIYL
jgi:hypothetical protein